MNTTMFDGANSENENPSSFLSLAKSQGMHEDHKRGGKPTQKIDKNVVDNFYRKNIMEAKLHQRSSVNHQSNHDLLSKKWSVPSRGGSKQEMKTKQKKKKTGAQSFDLRKIGSRAAAAAP